MDRDFPPVISSSMRPSKSLISQVKSTLSGLVSSVFKRKNSTTEARIEPVDRENHGTMDNDGETEDGKSVANGDSGSPLSKSHYLRSREAFQKRLKTFTLPLWCGKPLCMSPPLLAQYGWECVGENMAKCCICAAVITVHLPWPNSSNYHVICKESQQKIIKGHTTVCSWPNNPASDSYVNPFNDYLSHDDKTKLKSHYMKKAKRLLQLKKDLPHITQDTLADMELDRNMLSRLIGIVDFDESSSSDYSLLISSACLALCGWDTDSNSRLSSVCCTETGRLVGLWNFYSASCDDHSEDMLPTKRRKLDDGKSNLTIEKSFFHPVSQHHIWSPWIVTLNSTSVSMNDPGLGSIKADAIPGWKILLSILMESENPKMNGINSSSLDSTAAVKSPPPKEAVLKARRMFADWHSP